MQRVQSDSGFSLVEMMMVVAIIGLMTSAVVLMMPTKNEGLTASLRSTERAFIALSRQSVMSGRVIGLRFTADGFQTQLLGDDGWQDDDTILKRDALIWSPYFLTNLEVSGQSLDLNDEKLGPHVWFLPTNEAVAFTATFSSEGEAGSIKVNHIGQTKVLTDG